MKKYMYIDSVISTILVFLTMFLLPVIFEIDILKPFRDTLSDFELTDLSYSELHDSALSKADTNIVIVDVAGMNPLEISNILHSIGSRKPAAVGIDLPLVKTGNKFHDKVLEDAFDKLENYVIAVDIMKCGKDKDRFESFSKPEIVINSNYKFGFHNLLFDLDKEYFTVRSFYPKCKGADTVIGNYAVELLRMSHPGKVERLLEREYEQEIINYRGSFRKFRFISGADIISENYLEGFFEDKIILIGKVGAFRSFELLDNLYFTPLNPLAPGRSFPDMTRTEIHANIISMILDEHFTGSMPRWLSIIAAVVFCFINVLIFSIINERSPKWYEISSLMIFLIESILILYFTVIIFHDLNYELNLTEALFAIALSVFVYQIYAESLKPMSKGIIKKFKKV